MQIPLRLKAHHGLLEAENICLKVLLARFFILTIACNKVKYYYLILSFTRITMRRLILLLCLLTSVASLSAQSPGGVGTANLSGWWDANSLTTGNVTSWSSTYPTGANTIVLNEPGSPYPQATNTPTNASSNYNTTIDFVGNTAAASMVLENQANLDLLDNSFSSGQGSFFVAYYLPQSSIQAGCHIINYRETNSGTVDGIQLRAKLGTNTGRCAIGTNNSVNASRNWTQDFEPDIISYYGNRSGSSTYHVFESAAELPTPTSGSGTSGSTGLHVGARRSNSTYSGMYDGYISELIFFDRDLNTTEMAQVHTYLGVKYGVMLSNATGGGDYIASNGRVVWDASLNPGYQNDIIGIARDDSSGLMQKQSHTFSDDFRLYIDFLQATNLGNSGALLNDNSYVVIGNEQGALCGSAGAGAESPADSTYFLSRISREWKVTKTNFDQLFNLELVLDTCSIAGPVNPTLLRLLVDDDGNFGDATAFQSSAILDISYAAGRVLVSGISDAVIPNDSTTYFTIAYGLPLATIADTTICSGDSVQLTFAVSGASGPIDVDLFDGTATTTYNNVSTGYTFTVFPAATTQYTVRTSGPLNCCQVLDDASTTTVTVASPPVVTANIISPASICPGEVALVTSSGALTYVWTGGVLNGQPFMPSVSATYTVTGTDANGCQDTAAVFIEVFSNPSPDLGADTLICTVDSLVLSPGNYASYVWQDNSSADSLLVFVGAGIYNYSVTVMDTNGCVGSDTVQVDVSVCVSVDDPLFSLISVYPNPSNGLMTLESLQAIGELEVRVVDALGRTVYLGDHVGDKSQLDLSKEVPGVYFIELEGTDFHSVVKVIKQ